MKYQRIKQTLESFMKVANRVVIDPKTKTFGRKKTKMLDEWHILWSLNIRCTEEKAEKALYMAYYNMITSTILDQFDNIDDLMVYLSEFTDALDTGLHLLVKTEN